jgi:hypothetical protein
VLVRRLGWVSVTCTNLVRCNVPVPPALVDARAGAPFWRFAGRTRDDGRVARGSLRVRGQCVPRGVLLRGATAQPRTLWPRDLVSATLAQP